MSTFWNVGVDGFSEPFQKLNHRRNDVAFRVLFEIGHTNFGFRFQRSCLQKIGYVLGAGLSDGINDQIAVFHHGGVLGDQTNLGPSILTFSRKLGDKRITHLAFSVEHSLELFKRHTAFLEDVVPTNVLDLTQK